MSERQFDIVVIGAGMAGASLAANLSPDVRALVLETEDAPGYHATGRSAALFSAIYGNAAIRALSRASESFLTSPPPGFAATPLVSPRGVLFVARGDQQEAMDQLAGQLAISGGIRLLSAEQTLQHSPLLRAGYARSGLYEAGALDIDVHALHDGYLRQARANGCRLLTKARVAGLEASAGGWIITVSDQTYEAEVIVNAAGAWADQVAAMARAHARRIQPMLRTALIVEAPDLVDRQDWPMTVDVEEAFYFKPQSGGVLISPADEQPVPPGDVQPDELDLATAIDRVEAATTLSVRRIRAKWAGLRSFAPDRAPVVGFDPEVSGFFWLAGQGGYGIQTAPALGTLAAALVLQKEAPSEVMGYGLKLDDLSPSRPALATDESRNVVAV